MGQKRELSLEVKFTEADKECLGRLVKDLVKLGATTSKVRAFCGAAALGDYPRSALFPITFTRTHDSHDARVRHEVTGAHGLVSTPHRD